MSVADGLIALVVEDDDFQRRTVARMLRRLDSREVRQAAAGVDAARCAGNAILAPQCLMHGARAGR